MQNQPPRLVADSTSDSALQRPHTLHAKERAGQSQFLLLLQVSWLVESIDHQGHACMPSESMVGTTVYVLEQTLI